MAKLDLIGGALVLGLLGVVATTSCGSSDTKHVKPTGGEAGEAGESAAGSGGTAAAGGIGGAEAGAGGAEAGAGGVAGAEAGAGGEGGSAAGAGGEAGSAPSSRLFNTGVDAHGVALPGGSIDPHYTLIQSADATYAGPDAIVTTDIAEGYWVPQSDNGKWIAPTANQSYPNATPCNAQGTYVWRTTFSLESDEVSTFKITGAWGADNTASAIRINGVNVTISQGGYSPLTPFTVDSGFVAGKNTLDFEVVDIGCPNGLRVDFTAPTHD